MKRITILFAALLLFASCETNTSLREKEVAFLSQGDSLKGTLFYPHGEGPFPAVVMIHGAAPATRNQHNDYIRGLVHRGVAVLSYDKRGCGQSEGFFWSSDFEDLAHDAGNGLAFLNSQPEVDPNRSGYWSAGQGGWIMIQANEYEAGDFLVGLGTPTVTPRERLKFQIEHVVQEKGGTPDFAQRFFKYVTDYLDYVRTREGYAAWRQEDSLMRIDPEMKELQDIFMFSDIVHRDPPEDLPAYDSCQINPPARSLDFDPIPLYEKNDAPVLLFYGRNDNSIPLRECLERVLPAARAKNNVQFKAYFEADRLIRINDGGVLKHPEGFFDLMGAFINDPEMRIPTE